MTLDIQSIGAKAYFRQALEHEIGEVKKKLAELGVDIQ
jgi:hypothetical protein